jgi:hypothetical protein
MIGGALALKQNSQRKKRKSVSSSPCSGKDPRFFRALAV